ncbi:MAG: hypothetical protein K8R17_09255 [Methanosarcinales archaeon]|nr:hypothetical protein [Methanosarcinales archaeon]
MNNPSPLACGLDPESFKPPTITLVEVASKFIPMPPEKGMVLLNMVKGQK